MKNTFKLNINCKVIPKKVKHNIYGKERYIKYDESKTSRLEYINTRIKYEKNDELLEKLRDINLLNEYKKTESYNNELNILKDAFISSGYELDEKFHNFIKIYSPKLVNPGTKGCIKGRIFNEIIKDYILELKYSDNPEYEIEFEKKHKDFYTSEKPDWYIYNNKNKKIIIGMNQLDLWGGGHQTNRGSKYLINNIHNTTTSKLLCVVCNDVKIKSIKNKAYNLFDIGFKNDTLCYINNLKNIIDDYFR